MSGPMIALDKQTGVRLVRFRETWRRIFSKIMLKLTCLEATMTCQDDYPCDALKAELTAQSTGFKLFGTKS